MAALTPISRKPFWLVALITGGFGAFFGLFIGTANGSGPMGIVIGAALMVALAWAYIYLLRNEQIGRGITFAAGGIAGFAAAGIPTAVIGAILGALGGWLIYWAYEGRYRSYIAPYLTWYQVLWHFGFRAICGIIFIFLITPILVVLPLSFNAENFFTFTPEMLRFDPEGYSLKHYRDFFNDNEWQRSFKNSLIIAPIATLISVSLGTLAAIGLSQSHVPGRRAIMAVMISPMIVPLIISATGMFFFYSQIGNWMEGTLGMDKNLWATSR